MARYLSRCCADPASRPETSSGHDYSLALCAERYMSRLLPRQMATLSREHQRTIALSGLTRRGLQDHISTDTLRRLQARLRVRSRSPRRHVNQQTCLTEARERYRRGTSAARI